MKRILATMTACLLLCAQAFVAEKTAKAEDSVPAVSSSDNSAASPVPRGESWLVSHKKREALLQKNNVDVLLIGDSITASWSKQPELVKKFFPRLQVVNLGQPADKTENILWRLRNHSFDKITPKVTVVMAGTNNSNNDEYTTEQIAGGVQAIIAEIRLKLPQTKILLLGIFPRGSGEQRIEIKKGRTAAGMNPHWEKIDKVNQMLSAFADGQKVVYLNINREFLNEKGELPVDVMPDFLHPNTKGYEIWGRAMQPVLGTLRGASLPAATPAKPIDAAPAGKPYIYKTSGGKERVMEIYFPPNHDPAKSKVPGMILFHGGAWLGGSLNEFRNTCAYFASRGLVCATADYQMLKMKKTETAKLPVGETHKRVCVIDAKSAIRWFKQHAGELGIDPARIITGGTSAGGHISALATMNPDLNDPADPMDIDTRVVAYVWVNPAFSGGDHNAPEIDLMSHLKADMPPTIVFFGDQDNWKKGWDRAQAKWESLGTKTIDLQIATGQSHGFWNLNAQWQTVMLIATDKFLVKHGLLTGEPTLQAPATGEKFISTSQK